MELNNTSPHVARERWIEPYSFIRSLLLLVLHVVDCFASLGVQELFFFSLGLVGEGWRHSEFHYSSDEIKAKLKYCYEMTSEV